MKNPIVATAEILANTATGVLHAIDIIHLTELLETLRKKLLEMIKNAGVGASCYEKLEEIDTALETLAKNEVLSAEAIEKMCEIVTSVNEQMHCFTQENVKQFQEEFSKQLSAVNLIRDDIKQSNSLQEEVMKQFEKEGINITQEQFDKAELYHEKDTSSFYLVLEGTDKAVKIDCSFRNDKENPSLLIPVYDVKLHSDLKSEELSAKFVKENSEEGTREFHAPQTEGSKRFEKMELVSGKEQDNFSYTMTLLTAKEKRLPVLTNAKDLEFAKKKAEKSVIDRITDPNLKYLLSMKDGAENGDYEVKYFEKDNTFAIRNKETGTLVTGHVTEGGRKIEFASQEGIAKSLNEAESIADVDNRSVKHKFCTISNDEEIKGLKCVSNNSKISLEAVQMFHDSAISKFLQANGLKQDTINALINDNSKIYEKSAHVNEKYMFRVEKMREAISRQIAIKDSSAGLQVDLYGSKNRQDSTCLVIRNTKTQEYLRIDFDEKGTAKKFSFKGSTDKRSLPVYSVDKNQTTVSFEELKQKSKSFDKLFMLAFDNCEQKTAQKTNAENIRLVSESKPTEKEKPLADTNSEKFINVYFQNPEYAKITAPILEEINSFMENANKLQADIQKVQKNLKFIEQQGKEATAIIKNPKSTEEQKATATENRDKLRLKYKDIRQKLNGLEAQYDSLVKTASYGIPHLQTYSKMSTTEQEKAEPYFKELHKVYSAFTDIDLSKATPKDRDTLEKTKMEALIAYADFVKEYPTPEKYLAENSPEINNEPPAPTEYPDNEPINEPSPEELAYYNNYPSENDVPPYEENETSAEEYEAMASEMGYN